LLVATACANPPEGRARWTLELLADAMVKLTEHESLSGETVRRRLAKNGLKPWRRCRVRWERHAIFFIDTANCKPTRRLI
jgi:hypothetical protein